MIDAEMLNNLIELSKTDKVHDPDIGNGMLIIYDCLWSKYVPYKESPLKDKTWSEHNQKYFGTLVTKTITDERMQREDKNLQKEIEEKLSKEKIQGMRRYYH